MLSVQQGFSKAARASEHVRLDLSEIGQNGRFHRFHDKMRVRFVSIRKTTIYQLTNRPVTMQLARPGEDDDISRLPTSRTREDLSTIIFT